MLLSLSTDVSGVVVVVAIGQSQEEIDAENSAAVAAREARQVCCRATAGVFDPASFRPEFVMQFRSAGHNYHACLRMCVCCCAC